MKLIIDIPEENYKKDNLIHFFECYSEKLDEVIKNGTPLEDYDFGFCEDCVHRNESRDGIICRHCYVEKHMYEQKRSDKE